MVTCCGYCHTCGAKLLKVLDGEEWCPVCEKYRRYHSHGWGAAPAGAFSDDMTPCPEPKPVKVRTVNTKPEADYYHRDTVTPTKSVLCIDPKERSVWVDQEADTGSTTMDRWHNIIVVLTLDTRPDEEDLRDYLNSYEGQSKLRRICDGHERIWDGNNIVGRLNDDAFLAFTDMQCDIQKLPESRWVLWDIEEWLQDSIEISKNTSNDTINAIAEEYENIAKNDFIVLNAPIDEYLWNVRAFLRGGEDDDDK